jgi:hypothetical protein
MTSAAVDAIEIEALQLNVGADAATTADAVDCKGGSDRGGFVALAVGSSTEGTVTCVQIDLLGASRLKLYRQVAVTVYTRWQFLIWYVKRAHLTRPK